MSIWSIDRMVWSMESKISFRSWIRNWMWGTKDASWQSTARSLGASKFICFLCTTYFRNDHSLRGFLIARRNRKRERDITGTPTRKIALSHARLFYLLLLIIIIYIFICSSFPLMMRNDDSIDECSFIASCNADRLPLLHDPRSIYYIPGVRKSVLIRVNSNGWPLTSVSRSGWLRSLVNVRKKSALRRVNDYAKREQIYAWWSWHQTLRE